MDVTITINLDNAAFDHDREGIRQEGSMFAVSDILAALAARFASGSWPMDGPILDENGNTVGKVVLE